MDRWIDRYGRETCAVMRTSVIPQSTHTPSSQQREEFTEEGFGSESPSPSGTCQERFHPYDKCSGFMNFNTHLHHISHCKTTSGIKFVEYMDHNFSPRQDLATTRRTAGVLSSQQREDFTEEGFGRDSPSPSGTCPERHGGHGVIMPLPRSGGWRSGVQPSATKGACRTPTVERPVMRCERMLI